VSRRGKSALSSLVVSLLFLIAAKTLLPLPVHMAWKGQAGLLCYFIAAGMMTTAVRYAFEMTGKGRDDG
jgi:hypothetical protein